MAYWDYGECDQAGNVYGKANGGHDCLDDTLRTAADRTAVQSPRAQAADRTAVQPARARAAATGPAPAPVASPPQHAGASATTGYERALDRGSRLSLKVVRVLLALLAVMFVASLVYTSVAGVVSKASSTAAAAAAAAVSAVEGGAGSAAGQDSSNPVSDLASDVAETVGEYVYSAQDAADAVRRMTSETESLADGAASALTELSHSLSR